MQRRQFLSRAAAATLFSANAIASVTQEGETGQLLLTDSSSGAAARRIPRVTSPGTMRGEMLYRPLGATGVEVSAIGMGGSHLGQATVDEDDGVAPDPRGTRSRHQLPRQLLGLQRGAQ